MIGLCVRSNVRESGQYKTRTADCGTGLGIKHGLGIKRELNIKCGLSLEIAVLTHKYKKKATFSVFSSAFELSKNLASPAI